MQLWLLRILSVTPCHPHEPCLRPNFAQHITDMYHPNPIMTPIAMDIQLRVMHVVRTVFVAGVLVHGYVSTACVWIIPSLLLGYLAVIKQLLFSP